MGEIIKIAKLYGLRSKIVKELETLEKLLHIKQESDVVSRYEVLKSKIHKVDAEIFNIENRNK